MNLSRFSLNYLFAFTAFVATVTRPAAFTAAIVSTGAALLLYAGSLRATSAFFAATAAERKCPHG
jgi:hypothetical protein